MLDTHAKSLFSRLAPPIHPSARTVENNGLDEAAMVAIDAEAADIHGGFGWLRGARDRSQMLELRCKDGRIKALSYGWLEDIEYDPAGIITLFMTKRQVKILGRNLDEEVRPGLRLFSAICRHRCLWVQQADTAEGLLAPKGSLIIDDIQWE